MKLFSIPSRIVGSFFYSFGLYVQLILNTFKQPKEFPNYMYLAYDQMMIIGTSSIPIVILTSTFSGMVTSVQSAYQFESWTPDWFVGSIVGESVLLELAPVITALVLTGRVGATIAAEIGTMRVTEQIDALESLSFNPLLYIVFPRIIAGLFMFPILVIIADFFGVFGGWFSAVTTMDVSSFEFIKGFKTWFHPFDAWFGLIKSIFFGFTITSISCFHGYYTKGGAQGVGKSTTSSVVHSCVLVVILDYLLAGILL